MYPLDTSKPWAVNQWYVAGFASTVGQELIARTFLNERVILFRDQGGVPHALSGICPHRMMPMELGRLGSDHVACGYHGLLFDFAGRCISSPTSSSTPNCSLRRFPLKEAGPVLWIWMGDPTLSESTPLPPQECAGVGADGWLTEEVGYTRLKSRYTLLVDNLFDLTHIAFVHSSLLGAADGGTSLGPAKIESRENRLSVTRTRENVPSDKHHYFNHPNAGDIVSLELVTELVGVSMIPAGMRRWDGPDKNSPILGAEMFIHMLTPETETSTHYWVAMTRDFRLNDPEFSNAWKTLTVGVVDQDREALEAIERMLQSDTACPAEVSMLSDAGALRARARIIQMIRDDDKPRTDVARPAGAAAE